MINFSITSFLLGIGTLIAIVVILDYVVAPVLDRIRKKKQVKLKELEKKEKRLKKIEEKLSYLDTQVTALEFTFKDFKKRGVK